MKTHQKTSIHVGKYTVRPMDPMVVKAFLHFQWVTSLKPQSTQCKRDGPKIGQKIFVEFYGLILNQKVVRYHRQVAFSLPNAMQNEHLAIFTW